MSILKVDVGRPVTLRVENVEEVEGQYGPQLKFESRDGDVLFVSKDTGERQLDRIGMSGGNAIGHTLLFEKVAKNGKTYLNINPAPNGSGAKGAAGVGAAPTGNGNGVEGPQRTTSSQPASRADVIRELDLSVHAAYKQDAEFVLAEIVPLLVKAKVPFDGKDVVAAIATVHISGNQRRS